MARDLVKRRIGRIAARAALVFAALVVAPVLVGLVLLRTERGHELLRRALLAEARKSVPGLSVGAIGGGLLHDLSLRNVEDLLFERGIDICHETVRHWWNRFGPMFAGDIRRQRVSRMRGFRH